MANHARAHELAESDIISTLACTAIRMPLYIEESAQSIIVRDRPSGMWVFGSIFVLSGLFALSIPFASAAWSGFVLWERAAVIAIGLGHLAGGAFTVWSHRETLTTFDRATGEGVHIVSRPFVRGAEPTRFRINDARAIEIAHATDSDGDSMYQLRLWLSESRVLPLQAQPMHGEARAKGGASRLRDALGLAESSPHIPPGHEGVARDIP